MPRLVPYNRKNRSLVDRDFYGLDGFYNMLDDFYNWPSPRSLTRGTFKIDVQENDNEYVVEAELPGVNKDEVNIEMN
ncbi:MAG: hypothetical protein PHG64_13865, partial [Paludibacter sp.]|nr:hypothetical protein [Paludibacter sp.]